MKNLITAIFSLSFLLLIISCDQHEISPESCEEYDVQCELTKDFVILRIDTSFKSETSKVDAYGATFDPNKWYIVSTEAQSFIPISHGTHSCESCMNKGMVNINYLNLEFIRDGKDETVLSGAILDVDQIMIHREMNLYNKKVDILLLGEDEVRLDYDGMKPVIKVVSR